MRRPVFQIFPVYNGTVPAATAAASSDASASNDGQEEEQSLVPQVVMEDQHSKQLFEDPTLYNLVHEERWQEAWNLVESDPTAPYNACVERNRRFFPLQSLCWMVNSLARDSPPPPPLDDPEFSDDEEENTDYSQEDYERNQVMCSLARFMIQQSHTIQTPIVHPQPGHEDGTVTLESHRSILTLKDEVGMTPLHVLLRESSDPNMLQILLDGAQSSPGLLEQMQASTDKFGQTVLHYACSTACCPFPTFRLIMHYFHGNRLTSDTAGNLPIHALYRGEHLRPRRLRLLLDGYHGTLLVRNDDGMLPLQMMVQAGFWLWEAWDEFFQRFLWTRFEAVLMVAVQSAPVYNDSWSTLHGIASGLSFIPTKFLEIALHFHHDATTEYDSDGLIPLHVGVSRRPEEESVDMFSNSVQLLITDATVAVRTLSGRLPLHLAIESNQPGTIVSRLAEAAPQTLSVRDPETNLAPFQLAAVEENNSLTTVYTLLRMSPTVL